MLWTTRMNEDDKNILINFMPLIMVVVFTVLILLPMYFLQKGVEKTIVAYNEDTGKFYNEGSERARDWYYYYRGW